MRSAFIGSPRGKATYAALLFISSLCSARAAHPMSVGHPGEAVYQRHCASCHQSGEKAGAKEREALKDLFPEQIQEILERGVMASLGRSLSEKERHDVAEYLSSKHWGDDPQLEVQRAAYCDEAKTPWNPEAPGWEGWGNSTSNLRFQPQPAAGLKLQAVPQLKLKWAFGFPREHSVSAQPVIAGGRLFVGTYGGRMYSIDARSGCLHWVVRARSNIRNAITMGKLPGGRVVVFFGDLEANMYAVDAKTGKLLWSVKADAQAFARITGSPQFYGGKLYVSMASSEHGIAGNPGYSCCKFRGSIVALNATSGKEVWRTYTISSEPRQTGKNRLGTPLFGPSGVGITNSPTLDPKHGVLYVATGNNYSDPATPMSDSVLALRMSSGEILWSREGLSPKDVWNGACSMQGDSTANCPTGFAKDFDFLASPILVEPRGKRKERLLICAQKIGMLALNPSEGGKVVWSEAKRYEHFFERFGWGPASDGERIYAGTTDGSMEALELATGKVLWTTKPPCSALPCEQSIHAAVTAIDGAVFSGSRDGHIRAHSTKDGTLLWDFSTRTGFKTVNGIPAKGGSIDGAGPTVAGGMVFVTSGYERAVPGNVLLAFSE